MALTAAHHAYGAVRFDTPWRNHVVHLSLWVVAAIGVCLGVHLRARSPGIRQAGLLGASLLILLAPVAWIGVFEGGYNHVVKNVLYYAGGSREASDWLFELTGVLQFPLGLVAGSRLLRWWRSPDATRLPSATQEGGGR